MGTAGQLLVKRYRLVRAVGQGSAGIVWEGHDTLLDRPVAIRQVLLPPDLTATRLLQLRRRIVQDAHHATRLHHPNIAAIYDVAEQDDTPYLVTELLRCRTLDTIVVNDGPLPAARAAFVARKILAALTCAHARGVQHGDIRPANVFIEHSGRVVLADFGLACVTTDPAVIRYAASRPAVVPESASVVRGVSEFLPPERVDGGPATTAADLWGLGATLHLAVTGTAPTGPFRETAHLDLPPAMRAVLTGLLAREPRKRPDPEAADRLLAEIEQAAPPQVVPAGRSRFQLIYGVAAAVVLAGAIGGWALSRSGDADSPDPRAAAPSPPAQVSSPATRSRSAQSPTGAPRLKLTWYQSPNGWRAGVPKGWTRRQVDQTIWWLAPDKHGQLSIEVTAQPGTDPLRTLREAEALLTTDHPDYRKIRLVSVSSPYGTAADWEFTWTQQQPSADGRLAGNTVYHQVRRVISTQTTTTVMTWTTTTADWERLRPTLTKVLTLFSPPAV